MGYFKDSFDMAAGLTLGHLAAKTGAQVGAEFVQGKYRQAYNNYRSQHFDPVIRRDLNELLVFGRLPQLKYPFPDGSVSVKKENFFKRHKKLTTLLIVVFGGEAILYFIIGDWQSLTAMLSVLYMILFVSGVVMIARKIGRKGANVVSSGYKNQLKSQGQQYWHIREYVRQALAGGEMDTKSAIIKISNTALAQQFPDTVDEIEANAFYYRQQWGNK